ncbi:MAG: FecR family protein [Pseudomonadota bacterium]
MPEDLQQFDIKEQYIESQFSQVGSIIEIKGKGKLVSVHRANQNAFYGKEGDPIHENDALYTLDDCRVRIEFKDKNTVIMAPDTHLDVDKVYESIFKGKKSALFRMTRGKAIFYALRLFRYPEMSFELKTPTATVGVRGTKFGTEIESTKEGRSQVLNRMFAGRSLRSAQMDAGKQNTITRVYGIEGEVHVTSLIDGRVQRLQENEILEADLKGLGTVKVDTERVMTFIQDVISGMVSPPPRIEPKVLERDFRREDLDRMEKMDDIKLREREHPPIIHDQRGGGSGS